MSALPPKADIGTGPRITCDAANSGNLAIFAAIRRASAFTPYASSTITTPFGRYRKLSNR